MYLFNKVFFSFQNEKPGDEGGQAGLDGGHLFEREGVFHIEVISIFFQEVGGDL